MGRGRYRTCAGACFGLILMVVSACGVDEPGLEAPVETSATTTVQTTATTSPATTISLDDDAAPATTATTASLGQDAVVVAEPASTLDALLSFDACPALLDAIRQETVPFVGAYGIYGSGVGRLFDEPAPALDVVSNELAVADSVRATTSVSSGGVDRFSTTNVQEIGVDEPDLVKTDGDRILAVTGGILHYVEVPSPGLPTFVSSLDIRQWDGLDLSDHQMFLSGDTVILLAQNGGGGKTGRPR